MMYFKPCPFCGKSVAELANVKDEGNCLHLEDDYCPWFESASVKDGCMHYVVCTVHKGGCGASTGWNKTEELAVKAWNERAI